MDSVKRNTIISSLGQFLNSRETIGNFLQQIGSDMGTELKLGEDGIVSLRLDGAHEIIIFTPEQSDRVMLHATVCSVAKEQMTSFFKVAMALNAQPLDVGCGALAFDEKEQTLILTRACNTNHLNIEGFEDMLDEFIYGLKRLPAMFAEIRTEVVLTPDEANWIRS